MGSKQPKAKRAETCAVEQHDLETGRGQIKDNALKAIVTSKVFKCRTEKAKKGKGSFQRRTKHKGREPYSKAA